MSYGQLSTVEQIESLAPTVKSVLARYGVEAASIENINHEYNSTFAVVTSQGDRYALRININSGRSERNVLAEQFFIQAVAATTRISIAKPVANLAGEFLTSASHPASNRELICTLFTWLDGDDLGDEPTPEQVFAIGRLMAELHEISRDLVLPEKFDLPTFDDFMWGTDDFLFATNSAIEESGRSLLLAAKREIESVVAELFARDKKQLIHADLHGWNLKWHRGSLAVFDFDDCGIGLAIQDFATALYYLDTQEQFDALKGGYESIRPLPEITPRQMSALLLQRRIHLLNYLYETQTPEHRELLPEYQDKTWARIREFLAS